MYLVSVGLLFVAVFGVAYAWAETGWGVDLVERWFTLSILPALEMLGRGKESRYWFEISFCGILVGLGLGMVLSGLAISLLCAVLAGALPVLMLFRLVRMRIEEVDRQLPAALDALASALRSGQSMTQAVQWVANESPRPTNEEFGRLSRELALGRTLEVGLVGMAQRVPSAGLKSLAMAVGPLRAMGANMIPALEGMADILRRRAGMGEKLSSLAAQAKMQLWVMGLLLPGLMLVLFAMEPVLIGRLFATTQGNLYLAGALLLQILGVLIARRILNPKQIWK
jgi:tight adherence protein B